MSENVEEAEKLAQEVDADILLFCGGIGPDSDRTVHDLIKGRPKDQRRRNILLVLTTLGGSPDAAYKMARCLQRAYPEGKFSLLVDWYCKSAGTLIAIGAKEIVMSDEAELGPLDTQLSKHDEIDEMTSGLTAHYAFRVLEQRSAEAFVKFLMDLRVGSGRQISTKTAADVAAQLVSGLMAPIYGRIDPMLVGEHSRAMMIAQAYGKKLGKLSAEKLDRLVSRYPSHSYVIDREEAAEIFGRQVVRPPTESELRLMAFLHPLITEHVDSRDSDPLALFLNRTKALPVGSKQDEPAHSPAADDVQSDSPAAGGGPGSAQPPADGGVKPASEGAGDTGDGGGGSKHDRGSEATPTASVKPQRAALRGRR